MNPEYLVPNHGFAYSSPADFIFFWGSDDWASGPNMLSDIVSKLDESSQTSLPDLLICTGRYSNQFSGLMSRPSYFQPFGLLNQRRYRNSLRFGSTPPHQGTIFGPGARRLISRYSLDFRLAADLDYFLQLSLFPGLIVHSYNLEIVHMSDGGISGKHTLLRLKEVYSAYWRAFGLGFFVPLSLDIFVEL